MKPVRDCLVNKFSISGQQIRCQWSTNSVSRNHRAKQVSGGQTQCGGISAVTGRTISRNDTSKTQFSTNCSHQRYQQYTVQYHRFTPMIPAAWTSRRSRMLSHTIADIQPHPHGDAVLPLRTVSPTLVNSGATRPLTRQK